MCIDAAAGLIPLRDITIESVGKSIQLEAEMRPEALADPQIAAVARI